MEAVSHKMEGEAATSPQSISYFEGFDPAFVGPAATHMEYAASLGLPEFLPGQMKGKAIIVGSSPSLPGQLEAIRAFQGKAKIFAINDAIGYLIDNGIVPDATLIFEISDRPGVVIKRLHKDIEYFVCSMCHPTTFDALKDYKVTVWHLDSDEAVHQERIKLFKYPFGIGGGTYTFTRLVTFLLACGFRDMEIFAVDSSFDDKTHFSGTPDYAEKKIEIKAVSTLGPEKIFLSRPSLARQADEFRRLCMAHHHMFSCIVHGEGMLNWIHREMYPQFYQQESEQ